MGSAESIGVQKAGCRGYTTVYPGSSGRCGLDPQHGALIAGIKSLLGVGVGGYLPYNKAAYGRINGD